MSEFGKDAASRGAAGGAMNTFIRDDGGSVFINVKHVGVARVLGDHVVLESPSGDQLGVVTVEAWGALLGMRRGEPGRGGL